MLRDPDIKRTTRIANVIPVTGIAFKFVNNIGLQVFPLNVRLPWANQSIQIPTCTKGDLNVFRIEK